MHVSTKEVKKWIIELKNQNVSKFIFKHLPDELKIRRYIRKANILRLIRESGRDKIDNTIIWEIL